jgi:hypothetical protein
LLGAPIRTGFALAKLRAIATGDPFHTAPTATLHRALCGFTVSRISAGGALGAGAAETLKEAT